MAKPLWHAGALMVFSWKWYSKCLTRFIFNGRQGRPHMAQNASEKPKAWMAWSSGKDSAWALHTARLAGQVEIIGLMTTITTQYNRISMHGVRKALLMAQAEALGLPLYCVGIPTPCSNEQYEASMREALAVAASQGVTHIVFGDLFLQDLKEYREQNLATVGMQAYFPLWRRDTTSLAQEMVQGGLQAQLTCIDPKKVPTELAGHAFNRELLAKLPDNVDPCGENGEFHSFVWDGPMFSQPIPLTQGETVERDGFIFTDFLPASTVEAPMACLAP